MKKVFMYLAILTVAVTAAAMIAYQHNLYVWQTPQQDMWIKNGQLFDGTSEQVIDNPGILVINGKISCIGNDCVIPKNVAQIDATGKAIVPGLVDLHGHFFGGKARSRDDNILSTIWEQFRYLPSVRRELIAAGITSYRSLGDV
ncbi:MAG: hypothetical protein HRU25_09340, partial [Psychrobium sp.]|nr:hypothetical protein [Psychrobium sp.]